MTRRRANASWYRNDVRVSHMILYYPRPLQRNRNQYFTGDPVPVPSSCRNPDEIVALADADFSLQRVLDSGILRIGISKIGGSIPFIYKNSTEDGVVTDLDASGELDGYEIACAKEATKRLAAQYNVVVAPEFDVLPGPPFFLPMATALEDDIVDVIWSQISVTDAREQEVDFVCPNFYTSYRIAAGAGVSADAPAADGPAIPVACTAVYCSFDVPAPFVLESVDGGTNDEYSAILTDTTDGYDYTINSQENLELFFETECPTCAFVNVDAVGASSLAPATRIGAPETPGPTASPIVDSGSSRAEVVATAVLGALAVAAF